LILYPFFSLKVLKVFNKQAVLPVLIGNNKFQYFGELNKNEPESKNNSTNYM